MGRGLIRKNVLDHLRTGGIRRTLWNWDLRGIILSPPNFPHLLLPNLQIAKIANGELHQESR